MIRSMTGFARREANTPHGLVQWELRAINHRYLEVVFKLPEILRPLEGELRQLAGTRLGRGRVEAGLGIRGAEGQRPVGQLNLDLARQVIGHCTAIAGELPGATGMSPMEILRWPGVLEQQETDAEALGAAALDQFRAALEDLAAARAREGARVAEMLERRCAEIEALVAAVQARLPAVQAKIRERLRERIAALGVSVDPERVEQEVVLLAQKIDVAEELDRLLAHVAEFRDTVKLDTPVGRRLDFLVQELNREANTLASKSADAETTRHAVDIKVLVEQIREQVQNVE